MTTGHNNNKNLAAAEFRRLADRNISNQLEARFHSSSENIFHDFASQQKQQFT
jgi:hypothetical protein